MSESETKIEVPKTEDYAHIRYLTDERNPNDSGPTISTVAIDHTDWGVEESEDFAIGIRHCRGFPGGEGFMCFVYFKLDSRASAANGDHFSIQRLLERAADTHAGKSFDGKIEYMKTHDATSLAYVNALYQGRQLLARKQADFDERMDEYDLGDRKGAKNATGNETAAN